MAKTPGRGETDATLCEGSSAMIGNGQVSVLDLPHPVAPGCDPFVVRYDDRGQTALNMETSNDIEHILACRRVQVPRWLVRQQEGRAADQSPGDRHSLLLASGELTDLVV